MALRQQQPNLRGDSPSTQNHNANRVPLRYVIALLLVGAMLNEGSQRYRQPFSPEDVKSTVAMEVETKAATNINVNTNQELSTSTASPASATSAAQKKLPPKKIFPPITPTETIPPEYRICKIEPGPQIDELPVRMKGRGLPIWYQCAGKPYDDFMYKVYGLIQQKGEESAKSKSKPNSKFKWGTRKYIVPKMPLNSAEIPPKKPRKILIIGNSHTRQMTSALTCQYRDDISDSRLLVPSAVKKNVAIEYVFETHDNLSLYVIVNHPFVYSKTWKATLEIDYLKHPLQELDAIVLGTFNQYRESKGTTFLKTTLDYQEKFPHQGVDFENVKPPFLEDFVKVYKGPIIWTSMFAHYNIPIHQQALEKIETLSVTHNRTNLRSVDGRHYIDELGGEECSCNANEKVGTCVTDRSAHVYKNGHRCAGDKGGQPDLIAWDVIEALHDVLKTPKKK